jgi:nucleoside-diphosphate-sugar epimerase
LEADFGFKPATPLRDGLKKFAEWHAQYYGTTTECEKSVS